MLQHIVMKDHTNVTFVENVSSRLVDCIHTRKDILVKKETNNINVRHVQKGFGLIQHLLYIPENILVKNLINVTYAQSVLSNHNFLLLI